MTVTADAYFEAHNELAQRLDKQAMNSAVELVCATLREGRQVITCGNGGSAATASHYVNDWLKSGHLASGQRIHAVSLVDNVGLLTAWANDVSYEEVFAGPVRALARPGDLVIAVSGSGNSPNVVAAVQAAHAVGAQTLAVVGYDGGRLRGLAQHVFWVPSHDMQLCEDLHLMFGHLVMKSLCRAPLVLD